MRLLAALLLLAPAAASTLTPVAAVDHDAGRTYCEPALFGKTLPAESDPLAVALVEPDAADPQLCNTDAAGASAAPTDGSAWALLADRGNCTFAAKAALAEALGATAVVVGNTLEGIYEAGVGDCDFDCDEGQWATAASVDPLWDAANQASGCRGGCGTGLCVFTSTAATTQCCLTDNYVYMGDDDGLDPSVYAVFASVTGREALLAAAGSDVTIFYRDTAVIDVSSIMLWALGVATVAYAAWRSAAESRRLAAPEDERQAALSMRDLDDLDPLDLNVWHGAGFLVFGSGFLLLLYLTSLYAVVTLVFAVASWSALTFLVAAPLCRRWFPSLAHTSWLLPFLGDTTLLDVSANGASAALVLWWVFAQDAVYAWVLQDVFGVCLCILFLSAIRLNSIRVAASLLTAAFVYDVFFVFITPLFMDDSVMIEVATAGGAEGDCDDDSAVLPLLLMLPRVSDWQGGFVMLGLGDVVLPGLLLSFALRYDYALERPLRRGYFLKLVAGYAVGLALADAAVYGFNSGQPALLYLVPCTLGVFVFHARRAGELRDAWDGPRCLQPELDVEMEEVDPGHMALLPSVSASFEEDEGML